MKQNEALAIMFSGQSVLLTGAAGTGKTYILNKFIDLARQSGKSVAVTATTGLAATHLNGTTIHAWSGIGVHDELPKNHFAKLSKQRQDQINKADVLIIDEISMLHDYRLDMVEETCRKVRQNDELFGGLQVVMAGDFFQLPPVSRGSTANNEFVTNSNAWRNDFFTVCYLTETQRQKNDKDYAEILNGIRAGFLSGRQIHSLKSKNEAHLNAIAVTKLLTTNADVDRINQKHLDQINAKAVEYDMITSGRAKFVEQLLKSCLAPQKLVLKKDAQVMFIRNSLEKKYFNGTLGKVIDFEKDTNRPIIQLNNGKTINVRPDTWELMDGDKKRASATQLPLRLAWAITVHKSQGMTLDAAQINLSNAFVEGMGYVALSRVKNMKNLRLDGLNAMALKVSQQAKIIDQSLRDLSEKATQGNKQIIDAWQETELKIAQDLAQTTNNKKQTWSEKLAKMRQNYPNAYMPWQEEDDKKLVEQFSNGKTIAELSSSLGRHKGSIKARLEKHFGEDIFVNV